MVELKKELPEIFEEFAEQRKNSFLAIKEVKEKERYLLSVYFVLIFQERFQMPWVQQLLDYVPYQMKQSQMQKKICQETYVH